MSSLLFSSRLPSYHDSFPVVRCVIADFSSLGHPGFGRRHRVHAADPVVRLDGLRPDRVALHCRAHRGERDSARDRHRQSTRTRPVRPRGAYPGYTLRGKAMQWHDPNSVE